MCEKPLRRLELFTLSKGDPEPWPKIATFCRGSITLSTDFELGTVQRALQTWNPHSGPKGDGLREVE